MSDDFVAGITDAQWAEFAKESGLPPEEAKRRYLDAASHDDGVALSQDVTLGQMVTVDRCKEQPFNASIWKIIGVKGSMKLCGPESDWVLTLTITFIVAGMDVATRTYTLSKKKAEVHDTIELFVFRASYTIALTTDRWCVKIGGSVGYWKGTWHDHGFNKTLFCFGDIL